MQIIPVIDIKNHLAVFAQKGQRESYAKVKSKLCPDADIFSVFTNYMEYYPFSVIYIADLDALLSHGDNEEIIEKLLTSHSGVTVWLDAGLNEYTKRLQQRFNNRIKIVLGTETNFELSEYNRLIQQHNCILSLDYKDKVLLGNTDLPSLEKQLTHEVLIMSLHKVGSKSGPDIAQLEQLQQRYGEHHFYVAGGVRDSVDLSLLQQKKAAGALIASCLHNKTLTAAEIAQIEEH